MAYARLTALSTGSEVPCCLTGTRQRVERLRDEVVGWWQITTSSSFLSDPVSRRELRTLWLPLLGLCSTALDAMYLRTNVMHSLALDILCVVAGWLALCCVPTNDLKSDTLCMTIFCAWTVAWGLMNPASEVGFFIVAIGCHVVGIHTLHSSASLFAASAVLCLTRPEILWDTASAIPVVVVSAMIDYRSARKCADLEERDHQLHQHRQAMNNLLEGASDGSCIVSTASGTVTSCSPCFAKTFGRTDLTGEQLVDLVSDNDVHRINELCNSVEAQGMLAPMLLTCHAAHCDFDAKLIPYAMSADSLNVCIQVQGERRFWLRNHGGRHVGRQSRGGFVQGANAAQAAPSASSMSISQTSAFNSDTQMTISRAGRRRGIDKVSTGTQTNPFPARRRPPTMPGWMCGRPDSGSEQEAGSENGAGGFVPGRTTGRRGGFVAFSQQPLLPSFRITGGDQMMESVLWVMAHWNVPKAEPANFCCQFHAAAQILSYLARKLMSKRPCSHEWRPHDSWQCTHCLLMHHDFALECGMCWTERPSEAASSQRPAARVSL